MTKIPVRMKALMPSFETIKRGAWFIFMVISCLLLINLLVRMVDNPFLQAVFIVIAIGLDLFRQYVVTLAKYYFKVNFWLSIPLWLIYLIHVSIVIIASAGFTLSEINAKSQNAAVYNMQRQSLIDKINSNETEIKQRNELKAKQKPETWEYRFNTSRIDSLQKANVEHYAKLEEFKEVKLDVSKDVFDSVGGTIGIKGDYLKLYLFLVIALLIELALLLTSFDRKPVTGKTSGESPKVLESTLGDFKELSPEQEGRVNELLKFAEALFTDNRKLNGDPVVSQKTGIPEETCAKYRQFLSELTIGDKTAIHKERGASKANFAKDELLSYIKTNSIQVI